MIKFLKTICLEILKNLLIYNSFNFFCLEILINFLIYYSFNFNGRNALFCEENSENNWLYHFFSFF